MVSQRHLGESVRVRNTQGTFVVPGRDRRRVSAFLKAVAALGCVLFAATGAAPAAEPPRKMSVKEIITSAKRLKGNDAASRTARQQLVKAVTDQHLKDAATARQVSLGEWQSVIATLNRDLSGKTRAVWIPRLRAAFVPEKDVLGAGRVMQIARVLKLLGDHGQTETMKALFERLHTADKPASWQTCRDICKFWLRGSGRRRREAAKWAQRAYDAALKDPAARQKASLNTVRAIGELYALTGLSLSRERKAHPEVVKALVSIAERGELRAGKYDHSPKYAAWVARMLRTPEDRGAVALVITGDSGHLQVGLTEILAWAHQFGGTMPEWKKFLEGKIADADVKPDVKAYWLLARAYAQPASKGETNPFIGKQWMTQALATAESASVRLYVVERIAMAYSFVLRQEKGLSFLASVEDQFAAHQKAFGRIRAKFLQDSQANARWAAEKQAQQERLHAKGRRAALWAMLMTAKRAGDQAKVEGIKRMIEQLDAQK